MRKERAECALAFAESENAMSAVACFVGQNHGVQLVLDATNGEIKQASRGAARAFGLPVPEIHKVRGFAIADAFDPAREEKEHF